MTRGLKRRRRLLREDTRRRFEKCERGRERCDSLCTILGLVRLNSSLFNYTRFVSLVCKKQSDVYRDAAPSSM